MIGLNNLHPAPGSHHRKKIVGRGEGSGHGGQSTRGGKGQTARSGDGKMTGFEGGQIPLMRRIPKRGFNNINRKEYEIVNIEQLNGFDAGTDVTAEKLKEAGLIADTKLVKILGVGELSRALTVTVHAFSKSAAEKIKAAGGKAETIKK
jgi:large subunit ribosomal protein L15